MQYGLQQGAGGMRCVPCLLNSGRMEGTGEGPLRMNG